MAQGDYREPFFLHRIRNVGWGGGVGIISFRLVELSDPIVVITSPSDATLGAISGSPIVPADYRDAFFMYLNDGGTDGSVVAQDAIDDLWVIDAFVDGPLPDVGNLFADAVAEVTAIQGRPPEIHIENAIIDFTEQSHTHPDGTTVMYTQGYTEISRPGRQESGWYHTFDLPEVRAQIQLQNWLVNFAKVDAGLIQQEPIDLEFTTTYSFKIYPAGTSFSLSDGVVSPLGGVAATKTFSGSISSTEELLRPFDKSGFTD